VGKFADRQPEQTKSQHVVDFVGAFDDLLRFGKDMAVQKPEPRAIHAQRIGAGEASPNQQCKDIFKLP
jgi:hypothetical protein